MNDASTNFETLRPHLLGVAYRMLGTWSDAEDAVQNAWVRIASRDTNDEVHSPRAWWTRVVVRQCLDERARVQRRRETYIGPWLPEPLGDKTFAPMWNATRTPAEQQTLRLGLLRLLQELTPLELAAFLLRDVFDDDYSEIARTLEREEAAVRQLVRRGREHLAAGQNRFSVDRQEHESLLFAFASTAAAGDVDGVRALLHAHCVAHSDGGGKAKTATRILVGETRVARFFVGVARLTADGPMPQLVVVNGLPALAFFHEDGTCDAVVQLVIKDGSITEMATMRNPDKLSTVTSD